MKGIYSIFVIFSPLFLFLFLLFSQNIKASDSNGSKPSCSSISSSGLNASSVSEDLNNKSIRSIPTASGVSRIVLLPSDISKEQAIRLIDDARMQGWTTTVRQKDSLSKGNRNLKLNLTTEIEAEALGEASNEASNEAQKAPKRKYTKRKRVDGNLLQNDNSNELDLTNDCSISYNTQGCNQRPDTIAKKHLAKKTNKASIPSNLGPRKINSKSNKHTKSVDTSNSNMKNPIIRRGKSRIIIGESIEEFNFYCPKHKLRGNNLTDPIGAFKFQTPQFGAIIYCKTCNYWFHMRFAQCFNI